MTAVEYIQKEFLKKLTDENYDISFDKIIKQAKAMEKNYYICEKCGHENMQQMQGEESS